MELSPDTYALLNMVACFGFSSLIVMGCDVGLYFARKLIKRLIKRKHLKKRSCGLLCKLDEDNNSDSNADSR